MLNLLNVIVKSSVKHTEHKSCNKKIHEQIKSNKLNSIILKFKN